jgi:AbrB family looped-hinge helix DNA binding protein
MNSKSVEIGKYGRVILPKDLREKYGVREGSRLVVTTLGEEIILIPVRSYEKPTDELYGSIKLDRPIEEPKEVARAYAQKKLIEDLQ